MKNKALIGVIVVLTLVIAFEGVYIFTHWDKEAEPEESYTNNPTEDDEESDFPTEDDEELVDDEESNSNDNTNEDVEDYVRLVNTREEGNQIVQEYEMVLNGEYQEFEITYYIDGDSNYVGNVQGHFANEIISRGLGYNTGDDFSCSTINSLINEDNFMIIKGNDDNNYLLFVAEFYWETGAEFYYYVFNNDLDLIDRLAICLFTQSIILDIELGYDNVYNNIFNLFEDSRIEPFIRTKIEDNKIYHYYYDCGNNPDVLEERVYTINNNELEYEVINTYQVLEVAGAC